MAASKVWANDVTIRPPATDAELDAFFRVAAGQFIRDVAPEIAGPDFRRFTETAPNADPARSRGAFRGETYLGGYLIDERWLRIGAARVRTGCVGVVVTRPEFRGGGVATALMNDAFAFARSRGCVLLMLHGLANFYEPFGYVDVFDAAEHRIGLEDVPTADDGYRVRRATVGDAPAMRELYDRHFGPHPGSFVRSVEQQAFQLGFMASMEGRSYQTRDGRSFEPPVVALDQGGRVRGYLVSPWGPLRAFGDEVAADDWPATLALLQYDAGRSGAMPEASPGLRWPLPPNSLAAMLLADHLTVRVESLHRPRANWMAAVIDLDGLVGAMRESWEERWRRIAGDNPAGIEIAIDGRSLVRFGGASVGLTAPKIAISAKVLIPLLFGFRNVRWAMAQPGTVVPVELAAVLEQLFPPLQPWIAPTDGC